MGLICYNRWSNVTQGINLYKKSNSQQDGAEVWVWTSAHTVARRRGSQLVMDIQQERLGVLHLFFFLLKTWLK